MRINHLKVRVNQVSTPAKDTKDGKESLSAADKLLHDSIEKFWAVEHVGILLQKEVAMSREDLQALETLDKDTQFIDGRYEVPMLWKDEATSLPNNLVLAQKRFGFSRTEVASQRGGP